MVAQPVETLDERGAPPPQRRALVEELVRAAKPGVLEDREDDVIGVAGARACEIDLLGKGSFERDDQRGEFG
jgi:hypothetical protein